MLSRLTCHEDNNFKRNLHIVEPPLSYIRKQNANRFEIAFAVEISYILLQLWHSMVNRKDSEGNSSDYIDMLNSSIPCRWFQISRTTGFRINGRLRREAGAVVAKYKNAGGGKIKQLNDSIFTLSILVSELESVGEVQDDLNQANIELKEWREKCEDLQKEKETLLKEMAEALARKDEEIESANEQVLNYIEKIAQLEKSNFVLLNFGKKINQLGKRQKLRRIKELKDRADIALWFLQTHGLEVSCLKMKESETGNVFTFDYNEKITPDDDESLEELLFLLDKFCASDELYHELTVFCDDLPRSYLIKQKRSDLNKLCHVESVPGNFPGAQISFSTTLKGHIKQFLEDHPDYSLNEPIKVKISGDGAKMSRTTNFMLLSFALLQTGDRVMSSKSNRTICVVNGPEKYDTLKVSMRDVLNDINTVIQNGEVKVDEKEVKIEMYLGGDYKFLLMMNGLSGASSDYVCLWCKVYKLHRWEMSKDLDFYNTGSVKRTLLEIKDFQTSKKCCCINPPLLDIELDHVILDELHLLLRITDRLTENIINEVMQRDSKADFTKKSGEEKGIYLKRLVSVINELGITFAIWEKRNADGKGSGSYDWTSLVGSEKKKLIQLLPLQLETRDILFPETRSTIVKLWRDFGSLYKLINTSERHDNLFLDIFQQSKQFIELFCSLGGSRLGYNKARVTPYMHSLAYHVPIFIRDHISFKQFTGQGVERNNDDAKKVFFQKSNKWDGARDVLLLEARQELLQKCERKKRKYEKQNHDYWEKGIVESQKKRVRSTSKAIELNNENSSTVLNAPHTGLNEEQTIDYKKMTVKQLRQEIKSKHLQVKGLSKLNKNQLIDVLKESQTL
ncbi:uncharacterized protein LOC114544180 [Dendronephthya gigantea]|uniref:uncharacterized protein LOC114544180 n=1 Tax=Dendronephthya gigantea TaxID=151771 RepID=UPI00106938B2|nr:uncharacterized protein LOC114544180 [Dendronephthya gigantea]